MLLPCAISSSVWGEGFKNAAVYRGTGAFIAFGGKHEVADGREISMDYVAKPTHYEPPRHRGRGGGGQACAMAQSCGSM